MAKLPKEFYLGDTVEIARALLGKYLARRLGDELLVCRIVETEAYVGRIDKACHAYNYRLTPRTETLFREGGCTYIYFTYGMHHCLNFVTEPEGEPSAVLIRGLVPIQGTDAVSQLRFGKPYSELNAYQLKNFLNGPGKVCKGLSLSRAQNGMDLLGDELFCTDSVAEFGLSDTFSGVIRTAKRVGIDYAEEAVDFPWRFILE